MTGPLQIPRTLFRHALSRAGLLDAYIAWRIGPERSLARRPGQSLQDTFAQIYARRLWVEGEGQDSLSGAGSTEAATRRVAGQLSAFLAEVGCRRLVDIGCGDFNWMRGLTGDFAYLGIDVVPEVIADNVRLHGGGTRRFLCLDATREAIEPGDVALCREVLFHLSFADGLRLLRNIRAAGFRYVVLTDDRATWVNGDITSGGFRLLNLSKGPFRLPRPERELPDDSLSKGRVLGVWPGSALPGP